MTTTFRFCLFLCMGAVAMTSCMTGAKSGKDEIKVLLLTGGHGFQKQPFFAMFDAMVGVAYTNAEMPAAAEMLKPGLEKEYDVVVMYDMTRSIPPEHQKTFEELLKTGIGVVALHHNLGAHRDWDDYHKIIGGKWFFTPQELNGKHYAKCTYAHGQDVDVKVADRKHPITRGLDDFKIHDETYKGCYVSPKAKVLLTTDHPKSNRELAWTTRYGKSPVFYLMLGHDAKAWKHPAYPQLVFNGIRWADGGKK